MSDISRSEPLAPAEALYDGSLFEFGSAPTAHASAATIVSRIVSADQCDNQTWFPTISTKRACEHVDRCGNLTHKTKGLFIMMNQTERLMGGWAGGGMWVWTVVGIALVALLVVVIPNLSKK